MLRKAIGRAAADPEACGEEARYLSDVGAIERLANIDSTDALKAFLATRVLFAILAFNQDWKRLSVAKAMASPYGSDSVPKQEG